MGRIHAVQACRKPADGQDAAVTIIGESRMPASQTNQRIDAKRLWDTLMGYAEIGATAKGGVRRLALSDVDKRGRDRFRADCEALGLTVRVDAVGNMFARRAGRDPNRLPVLFGSHLDSQPSGGKFDGALGVLAGLEVMRSLNDLGIVTEAPVELINWTDEEGARFGRSLAGSGVWTGDYPEEQIMGLKDVDGRSVGECLDAIGYRGPEPATRFPADAYFELHIEQGPILEREGRQIGIVTGAQSQIWYDAVTTGQDSHAGTTPPSARKDAMVCAARIIDLVDRMMRARGEDGRGTVGQVLVSPNSRNVIPGEVRFSVEFRHPDSAEVDRLEAQFPREAGFIARDCGVDLKLTTLFKYAAQPFDPSCVELVRQGAAKLGYSTRDIVSGAGHDAVYVARHIPTAMIFTPCKDGLSHNEAESIEPSEAEAGCQVLFEAVVARANRVLTP
jgi:beta-ureidopropionase / N-carbamoyl-L-amino-acid hydrolase